jgi:hypothetical protein
LADIVFNARAHQLAEAIEFLAGESIAHEITSRSRATNRAFSSTLKCLETFPCFIPVASINSVTVNGFSMSARSSFRREASANIPNKRADS